jgi:hypothetical protein
MGYVRSKGESEEHGMTKEQNHGRLQGRRPNTGREGGHYTLRLSNMWAMPDMRTCSPTDPVATALLRDAVGSDVPIHTL